MSDAKNGSIPVFPTALPALRFCRQPQRLEGTWPGCLDASYRAQLGLVSTQPSSWAARKHDSERWVFPSLTASGASEKPNLNVPMLPSHWQSCCCCCSVAQSCPTLQPHGLQHARLPCSSLPPRVCSNSCPLSQ